MEIQIRPLQSVNNPHSVHGIYPYRGKISALEASDITSQMPEDSILLDPFCGSGTILYEGAKHKLNVIGIDANPLAIILSRGKLNISENIDAELSNVFDLIQDAKNLKSYRPSPDYTASLFHEQTLDEVMRLASLFDKMSDYTKACFAGTVALAARGCNGYKWTSSTVGKNMETKRYIPFYEKLISKIKKHHYPIPNKSKIFYADSRNAAQLIEPESVDFIFSSPPYFDCLDYTAYYARLVYEILGYDRLKIKECLIQDFTNYQQDMAQVLSALHTVLKPRGFVIFVVGDKKIHGKLINGADFFNTISPFDTVKISERFYTGTSSQVFDSINKTKRKEQIIIWQKN